MKTLKTLSLSITLSLCFTACKTTQLSVIDKKTYTNQAIDSQIEPEQEYIKEILPYKKKLDSVMSLPLSYAKEDFTKEGYSSNEGNLLADLTLNFSKKYSQKNNLPLPDFCLLNKGGVRTIIPKGVVTLGNIFEVAPFENQLVFIQLNGEQMQEMFDYIRTEKVGHPLAGIKLIYKNNTLKSAEINGKPFDKNKKYWVVTIDYLMTGGDRMYFFTKSDQTHIPNIKLREMLIEEVKQYKILPDNREQRLIFEN